MLYVPPEHTFRAYAQELGDFHFSSIESVRAATKLGLSIPVASCPVTAPYALEMDSGDTQGLIGKVALRLRGQGVECQTLDNVLLIPQQPETAVQEKSLRRTVRVANGIGGGVALNYNRETLHGASFEWKEHPEIGLPISEFLSGGPNVSETHELIHFRNTKRDVCTSRLALLRLGELPCAQGFMEHLPQVIRPYLKESFYADEVEAFASDVRRRCMYTEELTSKGSSVPRVDRPVIALHSVNYAEEELAVAQGLDVLLQAFVNQWRGLSSEDLVSFEDEAYTISSGSLSGSGKGFEEKFAYSVDIPRCTDSRLYSLERLPEAIVANVVGGVAKSLVHNKALLDRSEKALERLYTKLPRHYGIPREELEGARLQTVALCRELAKDIFCSL